MKASREKTTSEIKALRTGIGHRGVQHQLACALGQGHALQLAQQRPTRLLAASRFGGHEVVNIDEAAMHKALKPTVAGERSRRVTVPLRQQSPALCLLQPGAFDEGLCAVQQGPQLAHDRIAGLEFSVGFSVLKVRHGHDRWCGLVECCAVFLDDVTMKRSKFELFDWAMSQALNQQIYDRLRSLMAEGTLAAGQRVPSLRSLAAELGCARGTVEAAYTRLIGEGWLVARGPAGTYVTDDAQLALRCAPSRSANRPSPAQRPAELLRLGLPALDAFPRKLWARLVARHARAASSLDRPDPAGHTALRTAIATYLGRSRGVICSPQQVFVVPAYTAALGLLAEVLLGKGDGAWIESPGYPATARVLSRAGARVVPLPVDHNGLVVAEGLRRARRARLAVVTPSHQSPMGVAMTLPRRLALLDWARSADAWVVEDDYDGEYRYSGHPLPALQSLDANGRVVYLGTFSKVLHPGLRLSYIVAPQALVSTIRTACAQALHAGCPDLYQTVVAEFLDQGNFARHVRKMRTLYAKRREYLVGALGQLAAEGLKVELGQAGMHIVIRSVRVEPDTELARRAQAAGFAVQALSTWSLDGQGPQGLLVGFTNVSTAHEAAGLVKRLRASVLAQ